ncbi:MAG: single-stranded DNA-binding protein, partial [Christensenellales bacterium]
EICDMLIAVNRAYNKSDYIPCIAWGRNARYAQNFAVGEKVQIFGRIQSREYNKTHDDGSVEKKIAYEVSVGQISLYESENE